MQYALVETCLVGVSVQVFTMGGSQLNHVW